jgi:hypothetical protein
MELLQSSLKSSISNMATVQNCDHPELTDTKEGYTRIVLGQDIRSCYAIAAGFEFRAHTASKVSYQYVLACLKQAFKMSAFGLYAPTIQPTESHWHAQRSKFKVSAVDRSQIDMTVLIRHEVGYLKSEITKSPDILHNVRMNYHDKTYTSTSRPTHVRIHGYHDNRSYVRR